MGAASTKASIAFDTPKGDNGETPFVAGQILKGYVELDVLKEDVKLPALFIALCGYSYTA